MISWLLVTRRAAELIGIDSDGYLGEVQGSGGTGQGEASDGLAQHSQGHDELAVPPTRQDSMARRTTYIGEMKSVSAAHSR